MRAGISTPHISSIERSKRFPSLEYALRMADALGVPLSALCDETTDFRVPRMRRSNDELPAHLQNFVLNEESTPYLQVAQRMSTLPAQDSQFLALVVDLLTQRNRQVPPSPST
jgi:transcriptional regulator with XRE-family HTH domain